VGNISKDRTVYATGVNIRQGMVSKEYRRGSLSPD
jgi:hypothetical protein